MKALAKILAAGLLLFVTAAALQHRSPLSAALGTRSGAALVEGAREPAPQEALETVLAFLKLSGSFYGSGGDPRVAERLPASEAVIDELARDVEFLWRQRRLQQQELAGVEVDSADRLGEAGAEVAIREYWTIRTVDARDRRPLGEPRSAVVFCRYRLARDGTAWKIVAWVHGADPIGGG